MLVVASDVSVLTTLNSVRRKDGMGRCLVERENDGLSLGLPISTVPHPPGLGKVRRTLRPAVGSQSLHRCLVHIEMFIHLCCKTQK